MGGGYDGYEQPQWTTADCINRSMRRIPASYLGTADLHERKLRTQIRIMMFFEKPTQASNDVCRGA